MADKTDVMDLVELQFIDNALTARSSELEGLKKSSELDNAVTAQKKAEKELSDVEAGLHDTGNQRKKLEDTVESNEQKIKSIEKKLFSGSVTDSKELSNYQSEAASLKKNNSRMEDEILELMEKQEELEPSVEAFKKKLDELDSKIKRIESEIAEKSEGLKHNIEGLKMRRQDVAARMDADDVKKYNVMKAKKGGIAVSVIRDNFCKVCNMEIPSKDAEKFVDSDTVYNCPVCGRLSVLYRPEMDDIEKEIE